MVLAERMTQLEILDLWEPKQALLNFVGMKEIIFVVEESPEGGYEARVLDHSIFTDGDDLEQLKANVKDAVATHFEADQMPKVIRLQ